MTPTTGPADPRDTHDTDRSTDFWRLLLADPDLLRSEFDAIVAAEWPDRPAVPPRRGIPGVPAPDGQHGAWSADTGRTQARRSRELGRPRQRSPPRSSAER